MTPNRRSRRTTERRERKKLYSLHDVQRAINIAIEMKKLTKGHLFSKIMVDKNQKSLCVFCGQNTSTKKECIYWAMTLIDRIQTVLVNPTFFHDNEIEALWLQHGDEYQNIKLPLNVTPPPKENKEDAKKKA